jgi:hypothetical protein
MRLGRLDDGPLDIAEQPIIVVNERAVDFDTLLHGRISAPFRPTVAVRLVGQRLPDLRPVVLTVGILDVGEERSACACQLHAAPEESPRRPRRGGIDVGLWEQDGHVLRVNRVVFGFAPMNGVHVQGMAEDTSAPLWGAEFREPVPGENALHRDDHILTIRRHGLEQRLRAGWHVAMGPHLAVLVEDTGIHRPGVQVDATRKLVWLGVESPEVSSS